MILWVTTTLTPLPNLKSPHYYPNFNSYPLLGKKNSYFFHLPSEKKKKIFPGVAFGTTWQIKPLYPYAAALQ